MVIFGNTAAASCTFFHELFTGRALTSSTLIVPSCAILCLYLNVYVSFNLWYVHHFWPRGCIKWYHSQRANLRQAQRRSKVVHGWLIGKKVGEFYCVHTWYDYAARHSTACYSCAGIRNIHMLTATIVPSLAIHAYRQFISLTNFN